MLGLLTSEIEIPIIFAPKFFKITVSQLPLKPELPVIKILLL